MQEADGRLIAERYRVRSALGRGGAGAVWLAHDERLDRDVAVKEIEVAPSLSERESSALRQRVLREARTAARLDEVGAVRVYDVFEEDDRAFIVMEVLHAPSLAELVADGGPLSESAAARLGLEVLETLAAAHREGVVHRDVKPSNVIVPDSGRARLTDFGIAAVRGDASLTMTGTVLGSPSYLAPEQARGETVGPAADLWGLGATLYYAVEGRPPF
ncbi:MAG: serine/threonine-protein kinase [Egibacteraceae bacterium]